MLAVLWQGVEIVVVGFLQRSRMGVVLQDGKREIPVRGQARVAVRSYLVP